jgi:Lysyl oxidase
MLLRLGVVVFLVGALARSGTAGTAAGGLPKLLLPDLDQRPPLAVSVRWSGPKHHELLVFTSSVENVGYGPLVVESRRRNRRTPTMRADQLIQRQGGGFKRVIGVGRLRYNSDPSHSHWHLLPFERYELRTLAGAQIVRDHKEGFCLTSDHRSPLPTLGAPAARPLQSKCASDRPRALRVSEGIAVGWGDIYVPAKEGQAIDITGVPPGDYDLVHRVNVSRLLREADYSNDDSSLRIRLLPPPTAGGLPTVVVLQTCETGTHC